jgi:hypothetical protein
MLGILAGAQTPSFDGRGIGLGGAAHGLGIHAVMTARVAADPARRPPHQRRRSVRVSPKQMGVSGPEL